MTSLFAHGELLEGAFRALSRHGFDWVVLRGAASSAGRFDDVDILVRTADARGLDNALASAGFLRLPPRGGGSHRFPLAVREHEFVAYDPAGDDWAQLDVLTEVSFGPVLEFRTSLADVLLARRTRLEGMNSLHPADEFWYLLVHDLLKRGYVDGHRQDRLRVLLPEADRNSPLAMEIERLLPGVVERLRSAIRDGDWRAAAQLGIDLRRAWSRNGGRAVGAVSAWSQVSAHLPAHSPSGLSVALVGPDGAGKTTLATGLGHRVPFRASYVYLGIWKDSALDEWLRRILGARLLLRLAKLLVKARVVALHHRLGRLVLLDRYTLDVDLPSSALDWKGRVTAWLVRRTIGHPDLIVLLDAPAELMYARKGEHDLAKLKQWRSAYQDMAQRYPNMVMVDAAQSAEDVRREVTALLCGRWAELRASASHKA